MKAAKSLNGQEGELGWGALLEKMFSEACRGAYYSMEIIVFKTAKVHDNLWMAVFPKELHCYGQGGSSMADCLPSICG